MMTRYLLICCLAIFMPAAWAVEMDRSVEVLPESLHEKTVGLNPGYIVARPATETGAEKPALLIWLHGGGGVGSDINGRLGKNAPIKYWNQQETHPFLIVAPQCLPKNKWKADSLQVLLEHLKETEEFDHDRIYLTGFSMGGYGTWHWAATYPKNFAAIAPLGGWIGSGGPMDVSPELDAWLDNLQTIPTWIFHGGHDTVVPADRSETMYQRLQERGLKELGLTIYPNAKHVYAQEACKDRRLYEWMLRQSRK